MDLSFLPLTLQAVDKVTAETLCLFVGEDERPLTGLAGLADWRLSGGLSRLLREGLLQGTAGEALLTPARRMPFGKLFLFGLGPLAQGEEELAARVAEAIRKLSSAGVDEAALQLPQRLSPELGVRTLVDVVAPSRAIVFGADPAALVRALSQVANRGGAPAPERRVVKVPGPAPRPGIPHRPAPPARPAPTQRAQPLEMPKAAPLPFTPSNAQVIRPKAPDPAVFSALDPAPPPESLAAPSPGSSAAPGGVPPPGANPESAPPAPAASQAPPGYPAPAAPGYPAPAAGQAQPGNPAAGAHPAAGATALEAAKPAVPHPQTPGPGAALPPATPRPPLPKTQRYVPPPPRPGKKKL